MAGPSMGKGPRNGNGKELDSLIRIEGIGETKAQWLKSIGITTVQDLARASADYLESRLRAEGHNAGRDEIEKKWIAQAQELVDEASTQQTTESPEVGAKVSSSQQTIGSLEVDAEASLSSPTKEGEPPQPPKTASNPEADAETLVSQSTEGDKWSTFASFAVEFQGRQLEDRAEQRTIVRHVETDTVQSWSSIEGENFKRWMLGQVAQARPSESVMKQSAVETPVSVKMGQLRLLQPLETAMPVLVAQTGHILSNSIRSDEPFALEVSFELIGDALANIAEEQASYCVQWDAKNLAPPHEIISLGDTEPKFVVAGQTSYTTLLPEVILHAGIYRLQILIILRGVAALPTFFDAPVLQVV